MKPFELDDAFLLSKVIDDTDIELDLNEFIDLITGSKEVSDERAMYIGGQFFLMLSKKLHKARQSLPEFMASMLEIEIDKTRKLKLPEIKKFFADLWKQEGIQDFFSSAQDKSK